MKDDKELAIDPNRNNNFRYDFPGDQQTQDRCPFAAHVRKTNPRADLEDLGISNESRRILRRGIQFGPEVSPDEAASATTQQGRGLIFAAYQSNIVNGFQFMQQSRSPCSRNLLDGYLLIPLRLVQQHQFPDQQASDARPRPHCRSGRRSQIAHDLGHESQHARNPIGAQRAVGCAQRRRVLVLALHQCPQEYLCRDSAEKRIVKARIRGIELVTIVGNGVQRAKGVPKKESDSRSTDNNLSDIIFG